MQVLLVKALTTETLYNVHSVGTLLQVLNVAEECISVALYLGA